MRVIVLGAGVMGASAAYHLARQGVDVVMIDKEADGRAWAAGAGIVSPWTSRTIDPTLYRMSDAGARYYPRLLAMLSEDGQPAIGYRRVGAMVVAEDPAALDEVEALVRERRAASPEAGALSRLAPREARALFPPLSEALSALHVSGAARVDGRLMVAALRLGARRHGALLMSGRANLVSRGGRIIGAQLRQEILEADLVIATAGAWAPALLAPVGVDLAVRPQRGQIVHFALPGTPTGDWPVILPMTSYYMLTFDDSRVVVGATRESDAGFDYRVTAAGQAEVLGVALRLAPGLAQAGVIETRIGFRPIGAAARPILAWAPGIEGLLLGNGLGPSGLTIGPYAGRALADMALGKPPDIDLADVGIATA
jgi:D-amino-acid dehydrogenase